LDGEKVTFYWKARNLMRHLKQEQFEELFENPYGFKDAFLTSSDYAVWGAKGSEEKLAVILDIHINLDECSLPFKSSAENGLLHIQTTEEFAEEFCSLIWEFFDDDNIEDFNEVSEGSNMPMASIPFPWLPPTKVFVFMSWADSVEGNMKRGNLLLLSREEDYWDGSKEFDTATDNLTHMFVQYQEFYERAKNNFDQQGNYVGSAGPEKWKYYNPKN
jgi:hypothetical protein